MEIDNGINITSICHWGSNIAAVGDDGRVYIGILKNNKFLWIKTNRPESSENQHEWDVYRDERPSRKRD